MSAACSCMMRLGPRIGQQFQLRISRTAGTPVGQVDDVALTGTVDGAVRLFNKTCKTLRVLGNQGLARVRAGASRPIRSPRTASSSGVRRECLPRPPQTWMPSSPCSGPDRA
jgi:hypothetical protein